MRERKDFTPNFILKKFLLLRNDNERRWVLPDPFSDRCLFSLPFAHVTFYQIFFEKKRKQQKFCLFFSCSLHTSKSTFILLCDFVFIFE